MSEWEKTDKILEAAEERKAIARDQMFSQRGERKAMVCSIRDDDMASKGSESYFRSLYSERRIAQSGTKDCRGLLSV